ncbi:MAG: HTH-type transcriptional regulator/antitoxin HigA [Gammaproteobacteria bacterium]|jgi:HTH-type transcriptional regulator/antitoxin HigA
MDIRPIKNNRDYEAALRRVEKLMSVEPGTRQGDELDVLATLVDVYEQKRFPIDAADPVEAILFRMDQQGLERKDLEPFLGSRHRVSEILNRKRGLTVDMIRRLHQGLGIPLEILIGRAA